MAFEVNIFKSIFLPFCVCCQRRYVYSHALCKSCIGLLDFKIKSDDSIFYFFKYRFGYKKIILSYKKEGQKAFGQFFKDGISKFLTGIDFDMVVSIPCSIKRKIFYGFDHMEYIGNLLKKDGICYINVLERGWGKSQKFLSGRLRLGNLENKIKLKYRIVRDKKIVLIDDVVTTGASMFFCENVLMLHGARSVVKMSISKV
ncbi:amidophosphoribosyltransferase [Borrelia sp. BU AG58]|uniref:amidophosphoribosyltransferase n=1 Tax=Borrelia sp. BU AG58 TaxID=2887345 RepID=UPI001E297199|nr:amidophosphoribosyltransferase [Borrelia sp. BU AG58]UER67941.1 amidophosphoribosyltransferase [Borrelia sp. BU AG58]